MSGDSLLVQVPFADGTWPWTAAIPAAAGLNPVCLSIFCQPPTANPFCLILASNCRTGFDQLEHD